jgi:Ca2+-transporting ATPase
LGQFKSLIIWILVGAGVISGLFGEATDAVAILAIVVLNAAIGFYQEYSAEKSIAALKQLTAPQATVRRDGGVRPIPAAGIVTGDILVLAAGDLVGADARLLSSAALKCVEAALTGESNAVRKSPGPLAAADVPLGDRSNLVFMGTGVATGSGEAVVVATGINTSYGEAAKLIDSVNEVGHLRHVINSAWWRRLRAAACAYACAAAAARHHPLLPPPPPATPQASSAPCSCCASSSARASSPG